MTGTHCSSRAALGARSTGAVSANCAGVLRKEPSKRAARAGSRRAIVEGVIVGCSPRLGVVVMVSLGLSEEVRAYAIIRKKGVAQRWQITEDWECEVAVFNDCQNF